MARRPSVRGVGNFLVVALLLGVVVTQGFQAAATHMPADKVVASSANVIELGTGDATQPGQLITTTPVQILSASFRSSSPSDLMLQSTLECAIVTDFTVPGDNNPDPPKTSSAEAEGRIRIWMTYDNPDPTMDVIPIMSVSTNPQPHDDNTTGSDIDKVTYCNQHDKKELTDFEEDEDDNPPSDDGDGNDELRSFLRLKHANAFNWVFLNTGNGIHTVRLWADFVQGASTTSGAEVTGYVGNRLLLIEPTKFPNDTIIGPGPGTTPSPTPSPTP
jgi:hypothetical protein